MQSSKALMTAMAVGAALTVSFMSGSFDAHAACKPPIHIDGVGAPARDCDKEGFGLMATFMEMLGFD